MAAKWTTVKSVVDPIGFNSLNDDLYAVSNFTDYISHDQGQTWQAVTFDHELYPNSLNFNDSKGILYQVVNHFDWRAWPANFILKIYKQGQFVGKHLPLSTVILFVAYRCSRQGICRNIWLFGMGNRSLYTKIAVGGTCTT